ncbi:MAG: hypothetical protein WDO73_18420 [Ignavibacteriota bacterium]
MPALSGAHPGVRAAAEKLLVHGQEYLCVLKYSASFAGEQLHSVTTTVSKVLQSMRRLSIELAKPAARFTEGGIRRKIARWLAPDFISELIRYNWKVTKGAGVCTSTSIMPPGYGCCRIAWVARCC